MTSYIIPYADRLILLYSHEDAFALIWTYRIVRYFHVRLTSLKALTHTLLAKQLIFWLGKTLAHLTII